MRSHFRERQRAHPSTEGLPVDTALAAGGIHGRKIRLIVEDNGYDPKKAVLATQKLLTQDKVFAILATLGSAVTAASQPMALDRGVPSANVREAAAAAIEVKKQHWNVDMFAHSGASSTATIKLGGEAVEGRSFPR